MSSDIGKILDISYELFSSFVLKYDIDDELYEILRLFAKESDRALHIAFKKIREFRKLITFVIHSTLDPSLNEFSYHKSREGDCNLPVLSP